MVRDDAVGDAALDHIIGDIEPGAVDEAGLEVALAIEFGDVFNLSLSQFYS